MNVPHFVSGVEVVRLSMILGITQHGITVWIQDESNHVRCLAQNRTVLLIASTSNSNAVFVFLVLKSAT